MSPQPSKRAKKWPIKADPTLLGPRLEALHEVSSEIVAEAYTSIDDLYARVAKILDEEGITLSTRLMYRSFAEQLWRFSRKYKGKTFEIESDAVALKFDAYGSDVEILKRIGQLFGLNIGKYFKREVAMTAEKVRRGLDADKPAFPYEGDIYFATDTRILYICATDGVWEGVELT